MSNAYSAAFRMTETLAASREKTDRLHPDTTAQFRFSGIFEDTLAFTKKYQLMSAEHWTRFVDQFRIGSDS